MYIDLSKLGYIVPVPVIQHFLEDLDRHGGSYTGFATLGVHTQALENDDFRQSLDMPRGMTGVYVTRIEPLFHAAEVIKRRLVEPAGAQQQ